MINPIDRNKTSYSKDALLDHLFDLSQQIIVVLDRKYNILAANQRAKIASRKHFKKELEISKPAFDSIRLEHKDSFIQNMEAAFEGEVVTSKTKFISEDNKTEWFEVKYFPLANDDGTEIESVYFLAENITHEIENQTALRESENLFRALVLNSFGAFIIFNEDMNIKYISPRATDITGHNETVFRDKQIFEFIHEEDREIAQDFHQTLIKNPRTPVYTSVRFQHARGNFIHLSISANNLYDDPDVRGIVMYAEDETQRREDESRLRLLDTAIESAADGIIIFDFDNEYIQSNIISSNKAFRDITGFSHRELTGMTIRELQGPNTDLNTFGHLLSEVRRGAKYSCELSIQRKDEVERLTSWTVTPVKMKEKRINYVIAIVSDITDSRKEQEERVQLEQELSSQQHLSQVGVLASGIVHNVRNPLSVVQAQIELGRLTSEKLLHEGDFSTPKVLEYLQSTLKRFSKVREHVVRINGIISDILNYHHMNTSAQQQETDLNKIIKADAAILQSDLDIRDHINTTLNLIEEIMILEARASDVTQIFLNLASNARDAMMEREIRNMTITSGRDGNTAWFEVQDTGKGIPEEIKKRLGEPFLTTKKNDIASRKRGSGSGLGMFMIIKLVKQLKGDIKIESEPGNTRIRVYLPIDIQSTQRKIREMSLDQ